MERFLNLEKLISQGEIPIYHKKTIAQRLAVKRGFNKKDVVIVKGVIDKFWIIAKKKDDRIECPMWHEVGILKIKKVN